MFCFVILRSCVYSLVIQAGYSWLVLVTVESLTPLGQLVLSCIDLCNYLWQLDSAPFVSYIPAGSRGMFSWHGRDTKPSPGVQMLFKCLCVSH